MAQRDAELAALADVFRSKPTPRRAGFPTRMTRRGYYRRCLEQRTRRAPYHAVYQGLYQQRRCNYSESSADWQPVADFTVPYDPSLRYVLEIHRQDAQRGRVVVINTVAAQYTRPTPRPRLTVYPDSWRAVAASSKLRRTETAATTNRKEIKHIVAALQRRYAQWFRDLEAWGETPEQPEPASLGSRVQALLTSLTGRGGDASPYTWMLAC